MTLIDVVSPKETKKAHWIFSNFANALIKRALHVELSPPIKKAIMAGNSGKWTIKKAVIQLKKENFPKKSGYRYYFIIK